MPAAQQHSAHKLAYWIFFLGGAATFFPAAFAQQQREAGHAEVVRSCFDKTCNHWNDTEGHRIEAHGAGMLQSPLDHRWYWYGESKKTGKLSDHGVNCYSADSVAGPWKNHGQVLSQQAISVKGVSGPFVVERPKVVYNEKSKTFVMWFHLDNAGYQFRHAGIAVATSPVGPFKFVHALQPDGIPSLDMSLFQDVDGKAYFIRSCDNKYTGISRLSDDYLNTTGLLSKGDRFEGMAMFRHTTGTLYMMTSHLTGWNPNPLMLFRSDGPDLSNPKWVNLGNPTNDSTSFNTQPTYVVPFTTKNGQKYHIYMADNWVHGGPAGLVDASYVWLPINFSPDGVHLDRLTAWDLQAPFGDNAASVLV